MAWVFSGVFVWWWLSWGAIILALISTASIMPDFVVGGAVETTVSKPISRLKLFSLKVCGALLFVFLQVTISVVLAYLLMGLRFGLWYHEALWAIPLLTILFLYLYSVAALVGILTKSPLASLLSVLLFWGFVSLVQFSSNQLDSQLAQTQRLVERIETRIEAVQAEAAAEDRQLTPLEQSRINAWERQAAPNRSTLATLAPWQDPIRTMEACVPKTADIQKIIANRIDAPTFNQLVATLGGFEMESMAAAGIQDRDFAEDMRETGIAGSKAARRVNTFGSLGSSLAFTAIVLAVGAFIFWRRDF
jgi:hypothetical protein